MRFSGARSLEALLLISSFLHASGFLKLKIIPDKGAIFNINRSQVKGSQCQVCTGEGIKVCGGSAVLRDSRAYSVEFQCLKPQDVIHVEILRNIDCTSRSCGGDIIQAETGSLPLMGFNRTFTWNLKAAASKAFRIDLTETGLRQVVNPSEGCPDQHTYRLQAAGTVAVGTFCRGGAIGQVQILNLGRFSVDVPAKQKLQAAQFKVSVGEEIKSLAKIKVILPKGNASAELFSPNYPDSFPDDDLVQWEFQVPPKQSATIEFLNNTQPRCKKKRTAIEYHSKGQILLVPPLADAQPARKMDNFSMTLRNCEMDLSRTGAPGLSLRFRVSSVGTGLPVVCGVDLKKEKGLSLSIERIRPGSDCEMKTGSSTQEKVVVPSLGVTQLSFQDCSMEDLCVTATRVIECRQLKDCSKDPVPLVLPVLPSCLPASLGSMTWTLLAPEHGTVELLSPADGLKQSLPGQRCNDSVTLAVAEGNGTPLGLFCSPGPIQKIQIHVSNVSVTAANIGNNRPQSVSKPLLKVKFTDRISDRYIFTVSPKKGALALLATPGWPAGMTSYFTVSWIVAVPAKMAAQLMFTNLSQPKCSARHTNIRVQCLGSLEEKYSRREDEDNVHKLTVPHSFYLNMSNCMTESGNFSVITEITLQKQKDPILTVVLSVVAALLVVFVIVLVVVCVVIRKKKKMMNNHQVSIYNLNGTSFRPGQDDPQSGEDDYHVYASIEDTLVYTHLLIKGGEMGIHEDVDTYRPFTGPMDPLKPAPSTDTRTDHPEVDVYRPFVPPSQEAVPVPARPPSHVPSMKDNELYGLNVPREMEDSEKPTLGPRLEPEGSD